jgi:hypothetical protein
VFISTNFFLHSTASFYCSYVYGFIFHLAPLHGIFLWLFFRLHFQH